MPMDNMTEMFTHELADMYNAEQRILDELDELAEETENDQIAEAFREHRNETEQQIDRLEQVFDEIGQTPSQEECEGIEGIVAERQEIRGEQPSPQILDVFNTAAAEKTEHYEIAAYTGLSRLAEKMGLDEAGELLNESLQEEERMLNRIEQLTQEYDWEQIER